MCITVTNCYLVYIHALYKRSSRKQNVTLDIIIKSSAFFYKIRNPRKENHRKMLPYQNRELLATRNKNDLQKVIHLEMLLTPFSYDPRCIIYVSFYMLQHISEYENHIKVISDQLWTKCNIPDQRSTRRCRNNPAGLLFCVYMSSSSVIIFTLVKFSLSKKLFF